MSVERIEAAMHELISIVRAARDDEGRPLESMECDFDAITKSGKVEFWTVTVKRNAKASIEDN